MSDSQFASEQRSKWDNVVRTHDAWAVRRVSSGEESVSPISDFEWLAENRGSLATRYPEKHLAILDHDVIGVGETAMEAFDQARKKSPTRRPLLTYMDTQALSF
jgi:Family of unknown function (DUF5678)